MEATTGRRGIILTIVLGLIIARDLSGALVTLASFDQTLQAVPSLPAWALGLVVACGLLSAVSAVALFVWRRAGFYGICAAYAAIAVANIVFVGGFFALYSTVSMLFVIGILFALLVQGGEHSAWARMK